MNYQDLAIDAIHVGKRLRGLRPDVIEKLAGSMSEIGLLQPLRVHRNGSGEMRLVSGLHRLEAAKKLKWPTIRSEVIADSEALQTELEEIDENLIRGELSPAETALHDARRKEIYLKIHPQTAPGGDRKSERAKSKAQVGPLIDTYTAKAAKETGRSKTGVKRSSARGKTLADHLPKIVGTSLDKGEQLDALSKLVGQNPKIATKLVADAATGKKVDAKTELKKLHRAAREENLAEKIRLLSETSQEPIYGVIITDPPWARETWSEAGKSRDPANHYPTRSEEDLGKLKLPAAPDCILFMWSTGEHMAQAMRLIEAWGFEYKSQAVWVKPKISTGYWFRTKHELVLVATKGSPVAPAPGTQMDSVFEAPVGEHSEKPTIIHEMVERLWPETPRIEMFARTARPGWDRWGAEAPEYDAALMPDGNA